MGLVVDDNQVRQLAMVSLFTVAAVLVRVAWRLPTLRAYPAGRRAERYFWISVAAFVVALVLLNA
jgi:hypothetical protein